MATTRKIQTDVAELRDRMEITIRERAKVLSCPDLLLLSIFAVALFTPIMTYHK
jgi:hypothetical protein